MVRGVLENFLSSSPNFLVHEDGDLLHLDLAPLLLLYVESTKEAITDSITRSPKINELINLIDHSELILIYCLLLTT